MLFANLLLEQVAHTSIENLFVLYVVKITNLIFWSWAGKLEMTVTWEPAISKGFKLYLKNSLRIHEENTKENHNRVVSLYVIKTRVTLFWISLQIFLNIFSLRKQKLPNLRKELAYKTFRFLSRSKNSQYVLYRI